MNDTDIATLQGGLELINNQVAQIDKELDGHRGMAAMLEGMQKSLLSSASVIIEKLESVGAEVPKPPAEQLQLPFEVAE